MAQSLDEIEFLARSENRVHVLALLSTESHTRRELEAETGASQATLGRILDGFSERGWVEKRDASYEATAIGSWVANRFRALQQAVSVGEELSEFAPWLPTQVEGFDVSWLEAASSITPTPTEPHAPMDRVEAALRAGQRVRVLSYAYNRHCLDANVTAVHDRDQRYEGVYTDAAITSLCDVSARAQKFETLLENDRATVRVFDGEIPCSIDVIDETVHVIVRDDSGIVRAVVESTSQPLREWAIDLFERYRRDSTPLSD
ncbi:winged helix-turn-helix domain-containing protein [Haladaptatus sp. YSMS36]|uniref:helix-turn-helix transcriptional regulator n=1 Tax=Haladaptatus sp. YSMS36 TaxID=3033384 RepID=UPI0023E7B0F3|nr:ArsR family transcriptional regulator [Haladaptatus sp. YSMS36]